MPFLFFYRVQLRKLTQIKISKVHFFKKVVIDGRSPFIPRLLKKFLKKNRISATSQNKVGRFFIFRFDDENLVLTPYIDVSQRAKGLTFIQIAN